MQRFRGWCGVRYYEYQNDYYEAPEAAPHRGGKHGGHHGHRSGAQQHHRRIGQFQELVRGGAGPRGGVCREGGGKHGGHHGHRSGW